MSVDLPTAFGAQLRAHRLAAGLSQEALAERAGVSARAISALECGERRTPYRHTVRQLAAALRLAAAERARLEGAVRRGRDPAIGRRPGAPPPTNLPAPVTSFVGRARELAEVAALAPTTRLLTLTGAGGVGKTRLALAVAERARPAFADGVCWVDLAALADPALVARVVAAALDARAHPGRSVLATLLDRLAGKRLLLVLDNCEHLIAACAELAEALLRACPGLTVLATSREALGIAGELAWRVPSLSLPDGAADPQSVLAAEAGQLLVARAVAAWPAFAVTDRNAGVAARVCARLDGLPLALELAAARLTVLTLEQVAERLDDRFRLLTGGGRTALPRHRTLRATLDWSHDLLVEPERVLLRRLSVFAGGWDLEAAEAVCAGDGLAAHAVLDALARLADKSLVQVERTPALARYRLLETVRQYAAERLAEAGEADPIRRRHALHHLGLAEAAAPHLIGGSQATWLGRVSQAHDNLRLALRWAEEAGEAEVGLRLGVALYDFWQINASPSEGQGWLARALAAQRARGDALDREQQALRARALVAAGVLAWRAAEPDGGRPWFEEALALARTLGDEGLVANTLKNLGISASYRGDQAAARAFFEESLARGRAIGSSLVVAVALLWLGQIARAAGDLARARALTAESLAIRRREHGPSMVAGGLEALALVALDAGDLALARTVLREGLQLAAPLAATVGRSNLVAWWGCLAAAEGRPARALRLAGAAAAAYEPLGLGIDNPLYQSFFDRRLAPARRRLGAAAAAAWAAGAALSLEEAVAEALDDAGPAPPASAPPAVVAAPLAAGGLTRREGEVLRLLAGGRSNRAIAEALSLSVRTVERHVANLYAKIDAANRAEATAYAVRRGLL